MNKPKAHHRTVQKINLDLPLPLLQAIDAEAARVGIPRQSWIKIRIADVIDALRRDQAEAVAHD